eukprot:TRINITY_DN6549_c0_g1_i1.p1 TRINITY_DN6549_c0_g1~~TRINITY_DN6549_c0_g1_i1.p1  ORF type:complete len:224 (-),score=34.14 TRINITY_DN6549_c0_g1_i1:46-717(-)
MAESRPPDAEVNAEDGDRVKVTLQTKFPSSQVVSWVNPKLQCQCHAFNGRGMFVVEKVSKDEKLVAWAGRIVTAAEVLVLDLETQNFTLQIEEDLFQLPIWPALREPADFTNHSCEPNTGFGSCPSILVAMRDIAQGEEVLFDYAMAESLDRPGLPFPCSCGSSLCRHQFTADDWKRRDLWERYGDYFSPYLRRKIAALKADEEGGENTTGSEAVVVVANGTM